MNLDLQSMLESILSGAGDYYVKSNRMAINSLHAMVALLSLLLSCLQRDALLDTFELYQLTKKDVILRNDDVIMTSSERHKQKRTSKTVLR